MKSFWESRLSLRVLILGLGACCTCLIAILCVALIESISAQQSIFRADILYQNHTLVLEKNIKNLVILIPNEAHHGPQEDEESRFIEHPFLPVMAVVNVGTTVSWFNGDSGHEHQIIIHHMNGQGLSPVSVTNSFPSHEGSKPVTFDSLGQFEYADSRKGQNGFRMRGKISVVNHRHPIPSVTPIDTIGMIMVPAENVHEYMAVLKDKRFLVYSVHNFKNLSGPSRVGDTQALLLWGTSGMDISRVLAELREISLGLPYD